ncbi:hypothetical protein [Candidatus Alkanophaga liquidiphilum]|nr:hypothetical protein [Candidatus Alkanophaga liquidiphilum]
MVEYHCNACDWEGEPIYVYVCPACRTGHRRRLIKRKGGEEWECPNCSLRGTPDQFLYEPECPICGNQYIYEKEKVPQVSGIKGLGLGSK